MSFLPLFPSCLLSLLDSVLSFLTEFPYLSRSTTVSGHSLNSFLPWDQEPLAMSLGGVRSRPQGQGLPSLLSNKSVWCSSFWYPQHEIHYKLSSSFGYKGNCHNYMLFCSYLVFVNEYVNKEGEIRGARERGKLRWGRRQEYRNTQWNTPIITEYKPFSFFGWGQFATAILDQKHTAAGMPALA